MRKLARHGLAWVLAVALLVGGLPLAHAQDCAAARGVAAEQLAGNTPSMHDDHSHHHDDAALASNAAPSHRNATDKSTACKCLNCSSLCLAFLAPLPRTAVHERRVGAIVYAKAESVLRKAPRVVEPGIPIFAT